MPRLSTRALMLACAGGLLVSSVAATAPLSASAREDGTKHVLLISVDGLHQTDLAWYVRTHPRSSLATLVRRGVEFTNGHTPFPSDSLPGMTAPMTGGNPTSTGIFYDDSWNRALFPAAAAAAAATALHDCTGLTPGAEVTYFEAADKNPLSIDAGQGLAGLPGGMNFQTISTAEKLPSSLVLSGPLAGQTLAGGYLADGQTPAPLLARALDYINGQVGAMVAAIKARHLERNTVIILTAKHGQSPTNPAQLTRIDDGKLIDDLNAAWKTAGHTADLVAFAIDDDGILMWLNDRSGAGFAKTLLAGYNGNGTGTDGKAKSTDINGNPKAYTSAGINTIYVGTAAANFMKVAYSDARLPDVIGIAQLGTVYTGKKAKIAEHGGNNPADRDVALVVSGGQIEGGEVVNRWVETTQVAPTILRLLGLNPSDLKSVQIEHTKALPLGD